MNLFKTKMTAVDDSRVTTVEQKHVAWNAGLKGAQSRSVDARTRQAKVMKELWANDPCRMRPNSREGNCNGITNAYQYHTPAGTFGNFTEAMLANNVTRDQLKKRCINKNFPDWYRVPTNPDYINKMKSSHKKLKIQNVNSKSLMTPNGLFPSIQSVATAAQVDPSTIKRWMKKWPQHYYIKDAK